MIEINHPDSTSLRNELSKLFHLDFDLNITGSGIPIIRFIVSSNISYEACGVVANQILSIYPRFHWMRTKEASPEVKKSEDELVLIYRKEKALGTQLQEL